MTWNLVIVLRKSVSAGDGPAGTRAGTSALRRLRAPRWSAALAFIQDPGFLISDTKFDLVVDPAGFLHRALHLWDGQGAFGQLQNQAYGYLWPMGPFFWLGLLATARAGWSSGCGGPACCRGVHRRVQAVARARHRARTLACLVAGLAFALSPRMLTDAGPDLDRGVAERARALGAARAGPRLAARVAAPRGGAVRAGAWRWSGA